MDRVTPDRAAMEAAHYWNQFSTDWRPEAEETLTGTITGRGDRRGFDGSKTAVLEVTTVDGELVDLVLWHVHLLIAFKKLQAKIGDKVKVKYLGQDTHSPPGTKPPHRYKVALIDGTSGERREWPPAGPAPTDG